MKNVIFLGAGASKADNAPLQKDLLKDYFLSEHYKNSNHDMDNELRTFFYYMFGIDVDNMGNETNFPTFEEALGILDLAVMKGEAFRNFDGLNATCNSNRLANIRNHLIFLMARIIKMSLNSQNFHHLLLIEKLHNADLLSSIGFISTNYDILIDNALSVYYPGLEYQDSAMFRLPNVSNTTSYSSFKLNVCKVNSSIYNVADVSTISLENVGGYFDEELNSCDVVARVSTGGDMYLVNIDPEYYNSLKAEGRTKLYLGIYGTALNDEELVYTYSNGSASTMNNARACFDYITD